VESSINSVAEVVYDNDDDDNDDDDDEDDDDLLKALCGSLLIPFVPFVPTITELAPKPNILIYKPTKETSAPSLF
jgi:hypothetical protein